MYLNNSLFFNLSIYIYIYIYIYMTTQAGLTFDRKLFTILAYLMEQFCFQSYLLAAYSNVGLLEVLCLYTSKE